MERTRCSFRDLPEDLQTLIFEIVNVVAGEHGLEELEDHEFEIHLCSTAAFPCVPMSRDYRGEKYAEAMIGQRLPPVVMHGDKWLDGRHRLLALRRAGITCVECIDLSEIFPSYPFEPIGHLS